MAVTIKKALIEEIRADCSTSQWDYIRFHDLGDKEVWVEVRENYYSKSQVSLSKEDVKKLAEALLDWANS